jgi:hypothetical protein
MNNQELQNQINELKQQVTALVQWRDQRMKQQISFPLDTQSISVLGKYFLTIISNRILFFGGASGRPFNILQGQQDNTKVQLQVDTSQSYIVNPSTDIFTVNDHAYTNGDIVVVSTTDTQPSPLTLGTSYYVVSASGLTFKLSTTLGGSAINITDSGAGTQFIDYA